MQLDRIFVEWHDPERPGWGGYVSSLSPDFQKEFLSFVSELGPPTLVEFRASDEGWVDGEPFCDGCDDYESECKC